jgi:hypothetical protein
MATKWRLLDAERYPKYVRAFIRAFERLYKKKKSEGKTSVDRWANGEEMFWWWLKENREKHVPDQTTMFE